MTVCASCDQTGRCHTEIDDDGAYPICPACLIGLLADADRYNETLIVFVQAAVTAVA